MNSPRNLLRHKHKTRTQALKTIKKKETQETYVSNKKTLSKEPWLNNTWLKDIWSTETLPRKHDQRNVTKEAWPKKHDWCPVTEKAWLKKRDRRSMTEEAWQKKRHKRSVTEEAWQKKRDRKNVTEEKKPPHNNKTHKSSRLKKGDS